jgi:hypothetical protein
MAYEYPPCGWPRYNRRRTTCEFRGAAVPEELLLTTEQRSALDRLKEDESKSRPSFGSGGGEPFDVDGVWLDPGDPGESGE